MAFYKKNKTMKNRLVQLFIIVSFLFSILLSSQSLSAQKGTYYVVQYIKVPPTIENEYLKLETEVWKKMHQARIAKGVLDGWHLYRVISPNGSSTEYNYITILIYNSTLKLAQHFEEYGVDYTKVLNSEEIALALKTPELRNVVYEEVWQNTDLLKPDNTDHNFRFQKFNAMKTHDNDDEYVSIEQKYWKPVHQERIKMGSMHNWGLYHMIIPGGTTRDYTWATVDYYDRFIDIMQDELNDRLFRQIHNSKNADLYLQETLVSRDLYKTEIRELLDSAMPQQ
jgi:hypothetical protein